MGTRLVRRVLPLAMLAAIGVGAAVAATNSGHGGTVRAAKSGMYGSLLVSPGGRTLYHMTSEKRGKIACTGACAKFWPPLLLSGHARPKAGSGVAASKLGTIRRPDGRVQVTYNGLALYRYSLDRKAGDVKGQGVEHIWFAVTPVGKLAKARAAAPPATTTTPTTTGGGYGGGGYGG